MRRERRQLPTILLTGANGQLGFELRRSLTVQGNVVALDRSQCDLANTASLRKLVRKLRPAAIVNAAAYTAVDRAEQELRALRAANVDGPRVLAEEAVRLGSIIVHYSTDYVFDGNKTGAYSEADSPAPLSAYGMSKLDGELAVQAAGGMHLIFRTSWLFGLYGDNFLKSIARAAKIRESLNVVADQWGAPTSATLVADITALALTRHLSRAVEPLESGVYHLSARGETTWLEYARYIVGGLRERGLELAAQPATINPITAAEYGSPARRPANSQLDSRKLAIALGIEIPNWQRDVDRVLEQLADVARMGLGLPDEKRRNGHD